MNEFIIVVSHPAPADSGPSPDDRKVALTPTTRIADTFEGSWTNDCTTAGSVNYQRIKTVFDTSVALTLFLLALPLMVFAGLLVRMTSRGPILYSQTRMGRYGKPYFIYKIRTMRHNCEAASGARWSTKNDPRVTFVGRILRKMHIDELPQLWNILRGEMSLVGPRPERPEFVVQLERAIEGYRGRLALTPGLTGLAQIQLPPDSNLKSVRDKLALDLEYGRRAGLWLDFRLLVGTGLYLVGFSYASVRRLMRLPEAASAPALLQEGAVTPAVPTVSMAGSHSLAGDYSVPQMTNV